jgi:hypothetical protein
MTAHRICTDLHNADNIVDDPGDAGSIVVDKSMSICNLVSVGAETRTLARPTREGVVVSLHLQTDGGDVTVTVTGNHNETGDSTIVFSDVGQTATFMSFMTSARAYFWRLISHWGMGNLSPSEANAFDAGSASNTMTRGAGVDTAESYVASITTINGLIHTRIVVDISTLIGSATDLDIIGESAAASCHWGQITTAKNGTLIGGLVTCLEAPAGGSTDIDFYSSTVSTGTQDVIITDAALGTETALVTSGGAWTSGASKGMTSLPTANDYLYIINGAASGGTFSAGKFLIEFWGV